MERTVDDARCAQLVRDTLALYHGERFENVLICLSEVVARVLAESSCDPDDGLRAMDLCTRQWLTSGVLAPSWRLHGGRMPLQ